MYSIGGCTTNPGSCNKGLRSAPSIGNQGNMRAKGFEVKSIKDKKPTAIMPITASTLATIEAGTERLNKATAAPQAANIQIHNKSDPSWPPQIADKRYPQGKSELE